MTPRILATLLILSVTAITACDGAPQDASENPSIEPLFEEPASAGTAQIHGLWIARVIANAPDTLNGCAIGEIDAAHAGDEIVSVCDNGEVFVTRGYRQGRTFTTGAIHAAEGALLQCAIGDADTSAPGNEVVVIGTRPGADDSGDTGFVLLLTPDKPRWSARVLLDSVAPLSSVCVGDVDPNSSGDEILVAGVNGELVIIENGGKSHRVVASMDAPIAALALSNGGVALACGDGRLVRVTHAGGDWAEQTLAEKSANGAGLTHVYGADEQLLMTGGISGLALLGVSGDPGSTHDGMPSMRAAVFGDLNPGSPGIEVAGIDESPRLTIFSRAESLGPWASETAFAGDGPLLHLVAGELDERSAGLEVLACAESGKLVLVGLAPPK